MIQNDFENIVSACECLDQIFEHKVGYKVIINNLGSENTIKNYNQELMNYLQKHHNDFSLDSQNRLN